MARCKALAQKKIAQAALAATIRSVSSPGSITQELKWVLHAGSAIKEAANSIAQGIIPYRSSLGEARTGLAAALSGFHNS